MSNFMKLEAIVDVLLNTQTCKSTPAIWQVIRCVAHDADKVATIATIINECDEEETMQRALIEDIIDGI